MSTCHSAIPLLSDCTAGFRWRGHWRHSNLSTLPHRPECSRMLMQVLCKSTTGSALFLENEHGFQL
eukprot:1157683-Pelagomonas_calceolata.AAC.5